MAAEKCPKCGAGVQPTDTQCMDCGADLLEARRKAEATLIATARLPVAAAAPPRTAAATGRSEVGESADETRLRIFDQQLAEKLVGERQAAYASAGIALIICGVVAFIAKQQIDAAGGPAAFEQVTPAGIRHLGWAALADAAVTGMWLTLATLSAFLCGVGQSWRGLRAGQSIRAVADGEKPVPVGISMATKAGLLLFAIICPPMGLIMGLVFKLSNDDETAAMGGMLMLAGFVALLALVGNWLWGLAEHMKTKPRPTRKAADTALLLYALGAALSSSFAARRGRGR